MNARQGKFINKSYPNVDSLLMTFFRLEMEFVAGCTVGNRLSGPAGSVSGAADGARPVERAAAPFQVRTNTRLVRFYFTALFMF